MPPHALTLWSSALVAQWIEHGSPKAGVGGSIPLWGAFCLPRPPWFLQVDGVFTLGTMRRFMTVYGSACRAIVVKNRP